jgi:hypothetical protein
MLKSCKRIWCCYDFIYTAGFHNVMAKFGEIKKTNSQILLYTFYIYMCLCFAMFLECFIVKVTCMDYCGYL